jgi:hypothetical protein
MAQNGTFQYVKIMYFVISVPRRSFDKFEKNWKATTIHIYVIDLGIIIQKPSGSV